MLEFGFAFRLSAEAVEYAEEVQINCAKSLYVASPSLTFHSLVRGFSLSNSFFIELLSRLFW